jgi:hypothetical protein
MSLVLFLRGPNARVHPQPDRVCHDEYVVPDNRPDVLLAKLDALLDQAVRVVPRPRTNFAQAIRAMHSGRYDASRDRFRRLEVHELLARDITAAVEAGERADREPEFLERVSVRLNTG